MWQTPPGIDTSNIISNAQVVRILDAESELISQEPIGLGVANAMSVYFGPDVITDDFTLLTVGGVTKLTFLTAGLTRIKLALQFGRTGSAQISKLLFRILVNGTQGGRSITQFISDADDEQYLNDDNWVNIVPGVELEFQVIRDTSGNNSGGLFSFEPSEAGINRSPCAALRLERFV